MLSVAKFFADIAKALNAPTWLITHGLTIILVGTGSWVVSTVYHSKNQKIESVPVILQAIDTLRLEVKGVKQQICNLEMMNKIGHDSMRSTISKGFGAVKEVFDKTNQLNNEKFRAINQNIDTRYNLQNMWIEDLINRISIRDEKKNEIPYRRYTAIP